MSGHHVLSLSTLLATLSPPHWCTLTTLSFYCCTGNLRNCDWEVKCGRRYSLAQDFQAYRNIASSVIRLPLCFQTFKHSQFCPLQQSGFGSCSNLMSVTVFSSEYDARQLVDHCVPQQNLAAKQVPFTCVHNWCTKHTQESNTEAVNLTSLAQYSTEHFKTRMW